MTNLIDQHLDEVGALCRRAGAQRLDAFGSAIRADFDPQSSDLDFLVELDDAPPAAYAKAYFALKEGLESLFDRPVDLVTGSSLANPYFRERILSERQTVYARSGVAPTKHTTSNHLNDATKRFNLRTNCDEIGIPQRTFH